MSPSTGHGFSALGVGVEPPNSSNSFFTVINLFRPAIYTAVVNHHGQRDARLSAEAQSVIAAYGGTGVNATRRRLKTQLALQTILCMEYRCVCLLMAAVISQFTDC